MAHRTAFLDHIGVGVPDLAAAKRYYDELMPILGLALWYPPGEDGSFGIGPNLARGPQIFFYQSLEPERTHSRHAVGLQHLSFMVQTRAIVREVHEWARGQGAEIVHAPQTFPQYGDSHFATFWLDPHGFQLEAVSYANEEDT